MSDRTARAVADAMRELDRHYDPAPAEPSTPISVFRTGYRAGVKRGVGWADANQEPHIITRDEVEEAAMIIADFLPARGTPRPTR